MSKVEERSMQCTLGVPLPVELDVLKNGFSITRDGGGVGVGGGSWRDGRDGKSKLEGEPTSAYALTTAVARPQ